MAAATMYKMKPIYDNAPITDALPTNMYKMKSFHESAVDDTFNECPELEELVHRQQAVLEDLERLHDEIIQISSEIGVKPDGSYAQPKASASAPVLVKEPLNIVVNASPNDPPVSVFLLQKIIQQHSVPCSVISHIHSSLTTPLPAGLEGFCGTSDISDTNNTCLRLMWKDGILAPSLMVSVADQSPILGEVNILRYLCRLFFPAFYSDGDPLQTANIDKWLDTAIKRTTSASAKEGKLFIQSLNAHLGNHEWLVGTGPSLADIFCSTIVLKTNNGGNFPTNIQKWLSTCKKELPGFDDIEKLCKLL